MKQWIVKHYRLFRQNPDWYFFYAFLLSFPLSMRKILYFYPIAGQYNEITSISIYLSDLLFITTLTIWLAKILYNKYISKSIVRSFIKATKTPYFYLPLILVGLSFLSISWSENKNIALYRSIKLIEFILIYFYVLYNASRVPQMLNTNSVKQAKFRETFVYNTLWLIFVLAFISAIIGIIQFGLQHSIGLFLIKESYVSRDLPGVAKIVLFGKTHLRAYSLFPHPNIFGGFLIMAIIAGMYLRNLFVLDKIVPRGTILDGNDYVSLFPNPERNKNNKTLEHKINVLLLPVKLFRQMKNLALNFCETSIKPWNMHRTHIINIILFTLFLSLILTFSKSAWMGLLSAMIYIYIINFPRLPRSKNVPRGTFFTIWGETFITNIKSYIKTRISYPLAICLIILLTILGYVSINFIVPQLNLNQSYTERLVYLNPAINIISEYPLFGVGSGQFVPRMEQFTNINLEAWQFQPVHNVYLLVWSELGFIGFLALIQIIVIMFKNRCFTPSYNVSRSSCNLELLGNKDISLRDNCLTTDSKNFSTFATYNVPSRVLNFVPRGTKLVRDKRGTFVLGWNILQDKHKTHSDPERLTPSLNNYLKGVLIGFIVIMLFDHYFWDIQQGQVLLWLAFGIIAGLQTPINSRSNDN